MRVPKALGRINGDRSGCRQERGAVIWVLMEAGEMLIGVSAAGGKVRGGQDTGSWSPGGTVKWCRGIC